MSKIFYYFAILAAIFHTREAASAALPIHIDDVVNYGNRVPSGFPRSGIAQGALVSVVGQSLGPKDSWQGEFPLPTKNGIKGVTVTITSGGVSEYAVMAFANSKEVIAILPSRTPLGPATVTVNHKGNIASAPINVIAAGFGIIGTLAFQMKNPDGTIHYNNGFKSAHPGQTIVMNGTGLGAIKSNERHAGATDIPKGEVIVRVGMKEAKVLSAGRGFCCDPDPQLGIPLGIAAWDVIEFVVPDDVEGCNMSVTVQTGERVSNSSWLAVSKSGDACPDVDAYLKSGGPTTLTGLIKRGYINIAHEELTFPDPSVEVAFDGASVDITPADFGTDVTDVPDFWITNLTDSPGSCSVLNYRTDYLIQEFVRPHQPAVAALTKNEPAFDTGASWTITTPNVSQALSYSGDSYVSSYSAYANIQIATNPDSTRVNLGDPPFVFPGSFTLDNGFGGPDLAAFKKTLRNPASITWQNASDFMAGDTDRAAGITVKWNGGDSDALATIRVQTIHRENDVKFFSSADCAAKASDGQFTIPPFITNQLLPTDSRIDGILRLTTVLQTPVAIPGLLFSIYSSEWRSPLLSVGVR